MTRFKTTVLVVAALLVARGAGAAEAAAQATAPPEAKEASGTMPELEPGIPGLKMADVRDYKHLWREIEELQTWERGDRISVAEYRSKVIEKTVQYLGLDGAAAAELTATASEAVAGIRESFRAGRRPDKDPADAQARFSSDLSVAVTHVTAHLRKEPRHELFAPECKKWLLRLAFGPTEAKEAREARQAQAGKAPQQL